MSAVDSIRICSSKTSQNLWNVAYIHLLAKEYNSNFFLIFSFSISILKLRTFSCSGQYRFQETTAVVLINRSDEFEGTSTKQRQQRGWRVGRSNSKDDERWSTSWDLSVQQWIYCETREPPTNPEIFRMPEYVLMASTFRSISCILRGFLRDDSASLIPCLIYLKKILFGNGKFTQERYATGKLGIHPIIGTIDYLLIMTYGSSFDQVDEVLYMKFLLPQVGKK